MDYLVVAPNTPFFQWQIALLVQSFRHHKAEENLAVLLVNGQKDPVMSSFCEHFVNHPRVRVVRLVCDPDPDVIRCHGTAYAVKSGFVGSTFVSMPAYSVLRRPLPAPKANLTFSYQPDFTFQHVDSFGLCSKSITRRLNDQRRWLPVGDVFVFDNMPPMFFDRIINRGQLLAFDSKRKLLREGNEYFPKNLFRAAMAMSTIESYNDITIDTGGKLECSMIDHDLQANVINYCHGSPPDFSRFYYPMTAGSIAFSDHPYRAILKSQDTHASGYLKAVALSLSGWATEAESSPSASQTETSSDSDRLQESPSSPAALPASS